MKIMMFFFVETEKKRKRAKNFRWKKLGKVVLALIIPAMTVIQQANKMMASNPVTYAQLEALRN